MLHVKMEKTGTKHKNIIDVAAIGVVVVMIAAAVVVASRNRQ